MKTRLMINITALTLIMLSVILPTYAEANDTTNRVLDLKIRMYFTHENDINYARYNKSSYEYSTRYNGDGSTWQSAVVNVKATKNNITMTDHYIFNDFFPKNGYLYSDGFAPDAALLNEIINGISYTKGIKLYKNGLTPNSKIQFNRDIFLQAESKEGSSSYGVYYSPIWGKSLGADNYILWADDAFSRKPKHTYGLSSNANPYYGSDNLYTAADDPSIIITNTGTTVATISWETNNSNPVGTSYTLQYQLLIGTDPNIEAHWGAWTVIPVEESNTTTKLATTANVFQPDKTYRVRVQVNHIGGPQYNVYSDYVIFSTSADPAVRAAQEAAIAAQAAKKAAEETLQYSSDAKTAAENAQQSADSALSQINHSKYGLEALYNKIDLSILPDIKKVANPQGATLAMNQKFDVKINATGIRDNLRYRVICGEFDSEWQESNIITITQLYEPGVKTATILVSNNPIDPDNGAIAEDELSFFSL